MDGEVVSLRLEGETSTAVEARRKHSLDMRLLGNATFDLSKGTVPDVRAGGRRCPWGSTRLNGRRGDTDPAPIGILFTLAEEMTHASGSPRRSTSTGCIGRSFRVDDSYRRGALHRVFVNSRPLNSLIERSGTSFGLMTATVGGSEGDNCCGRFHIQPGRQRRLPTWRSRPSHVANGASRIFVWPSSEEVQDELAPNDQRRGNTKTERNASSESHWPRPVTPSHVGLEVAGACPFAGA